jgi:hypothetical protein
VFLQTFVYPGMGPNYFKYACFAATVPLGMLIQGRTRLLPVAWAAVAATVLFFLLSNFGVWFAGDGSGQRMYPLNAAGLLACYIAAIPFSLNSLYGNLLFSGVLFGGMEYYKSVLAHRWQKAAIAN